MGLDMQTRRALRQQIHSRYVKATKTEKSRILDEFIELTGFTRSYAARALRQGVGSTVSSGGRRRGSGRKRVYGEAVLEPLRQIWAILDSPCGKRLVAALPAMVTKLEQHGEQRLSSQTRSLLVSMSAATIDRVLAPDRKRMALKGRSGTKPGALLRTRIPIRTFADWDATCPGFVEVDLVAHEGGDPSGDFCQTLNLTDVVSGWTESRAVRNKARRWVFEALQTLRAQLPFRLLGLDSDNGGEFINNHLFAYCETEQITFTRSRPHRKNDNCYVEQKNYTTVRYAVGYFRYDTPTELERLNALYDRLRLMNNYFQPQMKLINKERDGAKVRRRYDAPQTPCQRLLASPKIPHSVKKRLRKEYAALNPAQLRREILDIQQELRQLAACKDSEENPYYEYSSPRGNELRSSTF